MRHGGTNLDGIVHETQRLVGLHLHIGLDVRGHDNAKVELLRIQRNGLVAVCSTHMTHSNTIAVWVKLLRT